MLGKEFCQSDQKLDKDLGVGSCSSLKIQTVGWVGLSIVKKGTRTSSTTTDRRYSNSVQPVQCFRVKYINAEFLSSGISLTLSKCLQT